MTQATAVTRRGRMRLHLGFGLSRQLWLVEIGIFLNMVGYGAVLPFEIIYLHDGRGFSLSVAGLVVGAITGVAVVSAPFAGPVIDRCGARITTIGGGIALGAGYVGLAFAHSPAQALAAAALAGAGNGALNPSQTALLVALTPADRRHRATAVSRVAGNAGIGIGGALGGLVAASAYAVAVVVQKPVLARVSPFQVTWIGCAAATVACLPFAPALVADAATAGAGAIGWTIYLGAAPTALGFATWAIALRRTSAGRMASLTYLIPLVAIVLGWAVLGETPPWLAIVGGVLCLAGVVLARRRGAPAPAGRHDHAQVPHQHGPGQHGPISPASAAPQR